MLPLSSPSWEPGRPFITETAWGNPLVESGPPPLPLSSGDYVFFHNSWNKDFPRAPGWVPSLSRFRALCSSALMAVSHACPPSYQPAWVVLDGNNLTRIVARASTPLWSPQVSSVAVADRICPCGTGSRTPSHPLPVRRTRSG
jgi:hypothetical protein